MKPTGVLVLLLFLSLCFLSGCTNTTPTDQSHDSRLLGDWKETHTLEILTFKADGTYTVTEGELANWSTASGGRLWMYGTAYTYALSENNTVLTITEDSYSRVYHRV